MSNGLFRKEVMDAQRGQWLGGISLGQPLSLWLLAGVAVFATLAIAILLYLGEYTRRTGVVGQLVPSAGLANVLAPVSGTLTDVRVREGEHVLAGQVLAVISTPRVTLADGDTDQAMRKSLQARQLGSVGEFTSRRQQLEQQRLGLSEQVASALGEIAQIEAELKTQSARQRLAEDSLARYRSLREQQFVTDLQVQQQESAALEQLGAMQSLQRQSLSARRLLVQLRQAMNELPAQIASLNAAEQRDSADMSQQLVETEARAGSVVNAPLRGTVSTLLGQDGQAVQAGQALLSILPSSSRLEAQLLVPSHAVGFVEPGNVVLLRYQAYPYQKFGHYRGHVARISRSALSPAELLALTGRSETNQPYYRVIVALDRQSVRAYGRNELLKPGLLVDADILGERRALWEWAVEPLYTLSGRMGGN